jgi:hypothetical protein
MKTTKMNICIPLKFPLNLIRNNSTVLPVRYLFTFLFIAVSLFSAAQGPASEEYLLAKIDGGFFNGPVLLYTDYNKNKNNKPYEPVKDSTGRNIKFESPSAALNYLGNKGWSMVSLIPDDNIGAASRLGTTFIFRRKVMTE